MPPKLKLINYPLVKVNIVSFFSELPTKPVVD